ncbi:MULTISPECIES: hypothetical protein [unclassified Streptomyces]|uniref:hypothetical protein n=1 Tax=unclassified Streptomyces TaxID=2593676 RepID=UPI000F5BB259|nr:MULTISPECIES: hypothetical protein [unclassified Streptomyces]MCX4394179.1 hypothetical protein [Streptomyces sp. NBC_01767]WSC27909.1 hypothetical protein OG902_15055 [Streptomyces sp. NBC_01768]WSX03789.1 hypothetical protein OG355_27100 [Streptomyces sp. NBC_00987]
MNLHSAQTALFKIYLDSGYRLAHRFDAHAYAAHMGLHGEEARVVSAITPGELDDFAASLRGKHGMLLKSSLPCTCKWIEQNEPAIIREYFDVFRPSRSQGREAVAVNFVPFVREYSDFREGVPEAVADVAEFELALFCAREPRAALNRSAPEGDSARTENFSWESLYWKPDRTFIAGFGTDPLSIFLGKAEMDGETKPTNILVAPPRQVDKPVILRLASVACEALRNLSDPVSASELMKICVDQGLVITEGSMKSLLTGVASVGAIGYRHVEGQG